MTKEKISVDFTLHHPGNLFEGFLKKKGKNLINRAPLRYVVIRGEAIYYFDTKKDEKNGQEQPDLSSCLGFINIKDLQSITGEESENRLTILSEKKKKSKSFVFYTETKDSFLQWFTELKKWQNQQQLFANNQTPVSGLSTFSSTGSKSSTGSTPGELERSNTVKMRSRSSRFLSSGTPLDGNTLLGTTSTGNITPIMAGSTANLSPLVSGTVQQNSPTGSSPLGAKPITDDDDLSSIAEGNMSDEEDEEDEKKSVNSGRSGTSSRQSVRHSVKKTSKEAGNLFTMVNSQKVDNSKNFSRHSVRFASVPSDVSDTLGKMNDDDSSVYSAQGTRNNDEDQFDRRRFQNIMSIFPIEREHSRYFDDGKRVDLTLPIQEIREWEEELVTYETEKKSEQKVNVPELTNLAPHDYASAQEKCYETLKQEDKFCFWSHEVLWYNTRAVGKSQYKEALLVLGNRNLYIVDSKTFKTETKVRINDIYHVVQSGYEDDIVAVIRKDREEQTDILFHFTETKKTRGVDDTSITVEDEEKIRGKSFANSRSEMFKEQETEIYLKKVEFFEYISAIFQAQRGSQLKIFFVNDVRLVARTVIKEEPIDLNEKNIVESTSILQIDKKHDFINLYKEPTRCRVMSEFGDKEVFFAGLLAKKNKRNKTQNRTIVITNRALYLFDPKKQKSFKRRIKLSEISRVYRNKKRGVLIDVPSEYPLCLIPKQNMEVFEDFINVFASLYFDNDFVQHVKENEFDSFDLEKSQGFKEKMDENENVLFVQNQLRNAIYNKDVNQVREYLAYADTLVGKRDPQETNSLRDLRIQASEFLADIRLQEFMKEKLQKAFLNRDFLEMNRMLDHIESIKKERGEQEIYKPLIEYLSSINKEKETVINKHLIMTRIEYLLHQGVDPENERRILHAIDIAKRSGFMREVEKYKLEYDREKQKVYIKRQLEEVLDRKKKNTSFDSDADRLISIIENAKTLGIYEGTSGKKTDIQKAFEENTKDFITNKSNNHNFKMAIEQTKKDIETNHSKLKKEIEKVQNKVEGYTNIDKALVEEAEKVIKEIEDIRTYQKKLITILDKTEKKKYKLEESQDLIERCKKKLNHKRKGYGETKDYRDLIKRANNTYNEVKRELKKIYKQEASNIAISLKKLLQDQDYATLKQKLDQINTLSIKPALVSELPELEKIIDEALDNLNTVDFMSKLGTTSVEEEYTYLDVEKVLKFKEFAERNPQDLTDEQKLSLAKIEKKVATEYKLHNELQEEKRRFRDIADESLNLQRAEELLENVGNIKSLSNDANELTILVLKKKSFNQYVREIQQRKGQGRSYDDIIRKASKEGIDANMIIGAVMSQKSNDSQLEDEINDLIRRKDVKKLQDFISRNSDNMSKQLLKMANAKLNNLRRENMTPQELIEQINNACELRAKEELLSAIEIGMKLLKEDIAEQSKSQIQLAIVKAKTTIKEITNKENISKIRQLPDEYMKEAMEGDDMMELEINENDPFKLARKLRGVQGLTDYSSMSQEEKQKYLFEVFQNKSMNSDNELLQRLTYHVNKLRAFCEAKEGMDSEEEKYIVERDNVFGQNLIKVLYDILNHKTKKRFFYAPKDPYEIMSGLKTNGDFIVKLVDSFDSNELVKRLKKEKKTDALSVQFIYFLLSERAFMFVIENLLTSDDYLKECYEPDSILLDRRYRDDIYPLMSLLAMFQFSFTLKSSTDMLAASPVSKLKGIVRAIVHYFVSNRNETKSNLELSGKEEWEKSTIGTLIRTKLVPTLAEILNHKFKSGFLAKYHIWQFIQDVAEQKRISAIDIGGINLPAAVDAVNSLTENNLDNDFKFETFICYALNRSLLAEFFESILKDRALLAKYYEQYALVMDKDVVGNTIKYFEIISQLPFELIEDPVKYNQKYNQSTE